MASNPSAQFTHCCGDRGSDRNTALHMHSFRPKILGNYSRRLNLPGIVLALFINGNKEMFTYLFFEDGSGFLHVQRKG